MSDTTGRPTPAPEDPLDAAAPPAAARAASASGWKTIAQVALIVAAVLLVQRLVLPALGIGGT